MLITFTFFLFNLLEIYNNQSFQNVLHSSSRVLPEDDAPNRI